MHHSNIIYKIVVIGLGTYVAADVPIPDADGELLTEVGPEMNTIHAECVNVWERAGCHPLVHHPACLNNLCSNCQGLLDVTGINLKECCAQSNPGACLDAQAGSYSGSGSGNSDSSAATSAIDPNEAACLTVAAYISICESLTPAFTNLPYTQQITCLCYDDSGNFIPTSFDNAVSSCYNYIETADATYAAAYSSGLIGFCTATAAAAPTTTASTAKPAATASGTMAAASSASSSATESSAASTANLVAGSGTTPTPTATTPTMTVRASTVAASTSSIGSDAGPGTALFISSGMAFAMTAILFLAGAFVMI